MERTSHAAGIAESHGEGVPPIGTAGRRSDLAAWLIWLIFLNVVCTWVVTSGNRRQVTGSYRLATTQWFAGQPLYDNSGVGFIYLPTMALVFAPYAALPYLVGEVLWRITCIGSFAFAISRLSKQIERQTGRELFLVATLVTLPLAWSSARNGQATLPMTACMILGAVTAAESRWGVAAFWLWLGVAVKPLAIVMLLLVGAVHPPLRYRLMAGLAGVLLVPFLFQSIPYVENQYLACVNMLRSASHVGLRPEWAQLFSVIEIVRGVPTPANVQTAVRIVAALLTLGLAVRAHATWPRGWAAAHTFALAACYLMLFNPRTENNTYSCLAPAIGLAVAANFGVPGRKWQALLCWTSAVIILCSWSVGKMILPGVAPVWLAPLGALLFTALTINRVLRGPEAADVVTPASAKTEAASRLPALAA